MTFAAPRPYALHARMQAAKPRIAVIGTGGTFAMHARDRFDWVEYAESGVTHPIEKLLDDLGELGNVAAAVELVPIPFRALGSTAITPADWLALARLIRDTANRDPDITGFVVTHGTATLEETAWFLDLTLDLPVPVVVTGAQRPSNTGGQRCARQSARRAGRRQRRFEPPRGCARRDGQSRLQCARCDQGRQL
ncbi:asparaginase domain-containing protein [Paraburkholderia xenovorans]|uniref:asparaginase domain-containing protein n=1 Tax=Paraburkholderia xenovorans TaxID=36873 RepID=UPI00003C45E0|nr:asparaginase domain-containing protein [Paraburkholderia xenovorans]